MILQKIFFKNNFYFLNYITYQVLPLSLRLLRIGIRVPIEKLIFHKLGTVEI
jgi:hypothetical protein